MAVAIAALGGCQVGSGTGRALHQTTTTPEMPGTTPGVPNPPVPGSTTDVGTLWTADGGAFAGSGTTVPYGTTTPPYGTGGAGGFGVYSDGGSFFPGTGGAGTSGSGTMGQPFGVDAGMP